MASVTIVARERVPIRDAAPQRNHSFDLLRIFFATLVLLAHAPEMTEGDGNRELLARLTHTPFNFGALAVDGFFLLSGYLIVKSWIRDPHLGSYLRKRVLRIVPGYIVAAVVCITMVGLLAPGIDHFFSRLLHQRSFYASIVMLGRLNTPPVYPGSRDLIVNGALWTIPYEFRCYLVVAAFGVAGLLRRRWVWLLATVALFADLLRYSIFAMESPGWHKLFYLTGEPSEVARLGCAFFVGGCFWLFREQIRFRRRYAVAALAAIVLVARFAPGHIEHAAVTLGSYLMFYLCQSRSLDFRWTHNMPDISYGTYLYGTAVEALWIFFHPACSPWLTFAVAAAIAYVLGWLSWTVVEKPMLSFKSSRRAQPQPGSLADDQSGTRAESPDPAMAC